MGGLGDYFKDARIQRGLSLKDVYKKTGISDSRLSRFENGNSPFEESFLFVRNLAELYRVDLVDLLLKFGFLDSEALSSYERVFRNVELLTDEEMHNIQEQIDLFTRERKAL